MVKSVTAAKILVSSLLAVLLSQAGFAQEDLETDTAPTPAPAQGAKPAKDTKSSEVKTPPAKENEVDVESESAEDAEDESYPEKKWRFGGGISYSWANQLKFNNVDSNGTPYEYTYFMDNAAVIALEVDYGAPHAWGIQVGIAVDTGRTITDFEVKNSTSVQKGTYTGSTQPKITFVNVYANVVYRWEQFYIPFGLNSSGVGVSDPPVPLKELTGGMGAQVGIGHEFHKNFAVEGLLRVLSVNGKKQTDSVSGTTNVGSGTLSGAQIGLKAHF